MAIGDIGARLDIVQYDATNGNPAHALKVADGVIAIWYRGTDGDGFVITRAVAADGTIGAEIDSWEFETVSYYGQDTVWEVSSGIFLCIYQTATNLKAISMAIAAGGTITKTAIDTLDSGAGISPWGMRQCARKGSLNVFVIGWADGDMDGNVTVMTCAADGTSITKTDTWEFETTRGWLPRVAYISGHIFAVAYADTNGDGQIATFAISDAGAITKSIIDTQEGDPARNSGTQWILKMNQGDLVLVAYLDGSADGRVATYTIDNAGAISAPIDDWEYEPLQANDPHLFSLGVDGTTEYFGVWFNEPSPDDMTVRTFSVDNAGTISAEIDNLTFHESTAGTAFAAVQIQTDIWAFVYNNIPGQNGFLATVNIETVSPPAAAAAGGNVAHDLVKSAFM